MSGIAERCDFNQGNIIDRRFIVEKLLGEGTFGRVYLVKDRKGTKFALKLLRLWEVHPEIRTALVKRFDMEYETGCISDEHLVHSECHGFVQGNPYIVMEFCSGGDLITILKEKGALNYAKVASDVLLGLYALHQHGKVHRDLKPENVLQKDDGTFALTDFGIAGDRNKRMTERNILGKPKQIFGTYAYMPPEQVSPKHEATVLPTTDIFSFGVMMFQLLTNELPFGPLDGERDLVSYLRRGKNGDWNKQLLMAQPEGSLWMQLIEGCLHPHFQYRFQSVPQILPFIPGVSPTNPPNRNRANDFQKEPINGLLLRVMQGEEYGTTYHLNEMIDNRKHILRIGRKDFDVANDISIKEDDSSYISRFHCTLEYDMINNTWILRDGQWNPNFTMGWKRSTNGTYINSSEVSAYGEPISVGDIISIGDTKLRVEAY